MAKQHITIHDIARELDVSGSTVSRALQNHPRISQTTRESVQKLATKYNYQPNIVASSLRRGKSKTVGVIVPRINRTFFANVIGGMEKASLHSQLDWNWASVLMHIFVQEILRPLELCRQPKSMGLKFLKIWASPDLPMNHLLNSWNLH